MPGARVGEWGLFDSPHSQELRRGGWLEAQLSARGGAQRGRGRGTGFSPVALQGADVSFWTNMIPHLTRTSVQRLRSLRTGRDSIIGFRTQN